MGNLKVRIVSSHARNRVRQMLEVLVKEPFFRFKCLFAFFFFKFLLDLLLSFVEVIFAGRRGFSIFLLHFYPIEVCVFDKGFVDFPEFSPFKVLTLVERILDLVVRGRRKSSREFEMPVQVEPSFGDVIFIGTAFFLLFEFPLRDLFERIKVLFERLIL